MAKDEIEMALEELEAQRNILLSALNELEIPEPDTEDLESEEVPESPEEDPDLM